MHKAKKHFKFVRVLKIYAVFLFFITQKRNPENALTHPRTLLSLPACCTYPRLRLITGANKSCSEWGSCCKGILLELHSKLFVFVDFL